MLGVRALRRLVSRMTIPTKLFLTSTAAAVIAYAASCQSTPSEFPSDPILAQSAGLFQGPVRSVIEHRCIHCHHRYAQNGGLNFQDRASVYKGDARGPFLVPGDPGKSRVWSAIFQPWNHPKVMPGDGWGLNQRELKSFLSWIETGAHWPEGREGKLKIKSYEIELEDQL